RAELPLKPVAPATPVATPLRVLVDMTCERELAFLQRVLEHVGASRSSGADDAHVRLVGSTRAAETTTSALPCIVLMDATAIADDAAKSKTILRRPLRSWAIASALRAVDRGAAAMSSAAPPATKTEGASTLRGARVLVAEDNPVNQRIATRMLANLGCTVVLAANGREAVQRFQTATFDAVLMDCQMPEMDGYQATRAIREQSTQRIPVIAMTAHAMEGDDRKCFDAGMDDYLTKPVSSASLQATLVRWVGRPKPESELG
ncbi:MAG: response regulator, partial [Planctomycetes bacterium]|nr:response regulator [Planctomycetota bacterium]